MHHIDTITKKEAEALGIINAEGLGFIKPQTAFKNITEQLLAEIKKGNLVWRKGWRSGVVVKGKTYGAQNYETQRPYTGANAFYIAMQNFINGTDYKFFLTPKQILERGAKIRKGAKPFPVFVFIKNVKTEIVVRGGENVEVPVEEKGIIWYYVYPIDLVNGLKEIKRKTNKPDTFNEIIVSDAETIISNMPKAPQIKHGGDKAFYSPALDYVQMPHKKAFSVQQEYYSVLFHELIHSTGSKKRLNRDLSGRFGDKSYASEELIAEIGAAFLCGVCEIDYYTINNSAAYLKGWSKTVAKEIESDPNFLKRTVFKAVRAANFIIGKTLEKYGVIKKDVATNPEVKEMSFKGKEISPNKTVKASVNKAIEDLRTLPQYKNLSAMFLGMFYSDFKKSETIENVNGALRAKMYEKFAGKFLDALDFDDWKKPTGIEYAQLSKEGKELIEKIEARLKTLKAKKSGTDLFPELAGTNGKKELLTETFIYDLLDLASTNPTEAKRIWLGLSKAEQKYFKYKCDIGDAANENIYGGFLYLIYEVDTSKSKKNTSNGITDAVLIFINAFLSMHDKTVTREDLAYILAAFQAAIKSGTIKTKHPLASIANQTQDKLVKLINTLKPKQKINLHISNKEAIESKVMGLHGLGFWNVIASAVIGKGAELLAMKALKKKEATAQTETKALNGIEGFTRADKSPEVKAPDTYRLNGELGKLLGDIQPYKYSIVLTGDPHAGKTEFTMQLANGFSEIGKTVGAFMLEQGGLESKDTKAAIERNVTSKNKQNVYVTGEASKGIATVKEYANKFNVIIIDSWQKLGIPSTKFDSLRHEFPNTIFIVIFQQNGEGGTRGGVVADYDTPVLLKVHKVDSTFENNYVEVKKNRGNAPSLSLHYMVKAKKTVNAN